MPTLAAPADMIRFRCPRCDGVNAAPVKLAGEAARCRECKKGVRVPAAKAKRDLSEQTRSGKQIEFRCEECGLVKPAPGSLAGRKVRCPQCDSARRLPTSGFAKRIKSKQRAAKAEKPKAKQAAARKDRPRGEKGSPYAPPAAECTSQETEAPEDGEFKTPIVLKIWGALIAGVQVLNMLLLAVAIAQGAVSGVVGLVISLVVLRMGIGLYRGEKAAVQGVGVLAGLNLLAGGALLVKGGAVLGLIVLGQFAVLLMPPLVVGIMNYKTLK